MFSTLFARYAYSSKRKTSQAKIKFMGLFSSKSSKRSKAKRSEPRLFATESAHLHPPERRAPKNRKRSWPWRLFSFFLAAGFWTALAAGLVVTYVWFSLDQRGLLHENDVKSLAAFGAVLQKTFLVNLAQGAKIKASNVRGKEFAPKNLLDADRYSYWATNDKITTPEIIFTLKKSSTFNVIRLRENIKLGQRIESFAVDAWQNGDWKEIASATSIGANRLIQLPENISTNQVRIRITKSPVCVALSDFGLFLMEVR